jgi:membrane-bound lytic murein transglycosylase D
MDYINWRLITVKNSYYKFKKTRVYFVLIVGCIVLIGIVLGSTSSSKKENEVPKLSNNSFFPVKGVELPKEISFAGESVPLEYFDIKEAFERELLINCYWHSQTLMLIKKSTRYLGLIEPILKKNDIPEDFKYLSLAESGFSNLTSPIGAVGFWQFVPATAKEYGLEINDEIDERYHVEKSTEAACKFLRKSYNIYKSWTMAAASYNAGRKALNNQIQRQYTDNYFDILLSEETSRYVFRILALKYILSDPQKFGFDLAPEDYYQPIPFTEISVNTEIKDLAQFAFEKGTNYKMLKYLNPWLRENYLKNAGGRTYVIKIPVSGFRTYAKKLSKVDVDSILTQSSLSIQ